MLDEIFSIVLSQSDFYNVTIMKKGAPGELTTCELKVRGLLTYKLEAKEMILQRCSILEFRTKHNHLNLVSA